MRIAFAFLVISIHSFAEDPVFINKYYSIYFDPVHNSLRVAGSTGENIIAASSFYQLYIEPGSGDTIRMNPSAGTCSADSVNGTTVLSWKDSNSVCHTVFRALLHPDSEEIKFYCETTFLTETGVIRQSLLLDLSQPYNEVYRRNSCVDRTFFQDEYWLGKAGVRFGSGEKTLLIYHTPEISSLQLNTVRNQLIVNLDYHKDHPFQHFPLRDSLMHEKTDLSFSLYRPGETRKSSFSIYAGKQVDFVPRLMLNPHGFLAAHIFTEHADWTDLPTHRAVYFGSEEIIKVKNATGGFVKHKIPVTKSVFYSNPDRVHNNQSRHQSIFSTPIATIRGTKGYLEFLEQLQEEGHEICLHTPDQFTATRPLIEEACGFMKKKFNSVTWIDHGYNNGPKNNRESFVCDGLNPASASYSKDIWERSGIRYFWNSYYEDFTTEDSAYFDFNSSIMHPYPGFGDASPEPLYWKNPTRTGNFYSWPTRDLLEMSDPEAWKFHFSGERLNDFVQQRAIKFQHCYPAGSMIGSGFWKYNEQQKIVIEPNFDKTLSQLASFRDRGLINLTTVRSLLDYWISCERIRFEYPDSATVKIINDSNVEIKGIAFAVAAKKVITQKAFQQKFADDDLIFWMDLKAGEQATFSFSN